MRNRHNCLCWNANSKSPPTSFTWTNAPTTPGNYTVRVRASDGSGNMTIREGCFVVYAPATSVPVVAASSNEGDTGNDDGGSFSPTTPNNNSGAALGPPAVKSLAEQAANLKADATTTTLQNDSVSSPSNIIPASTPGVLWGTAAVAAAAAMTAYNLDQKRKKEAVEAAARRKKYLAAKEEREAGDDGSLTDEEVMAQITAVGGDPNMSIKQARAIIQNSQIAAASGMQTLWSDETGGGTLTNAMMSDSSLSENLIDKKLMLDIIGKISDYGWGVTIDYAAAWSESELQIILDGIEAEALKLAKANPLYELSLRPGSPTYDLLQRSNSADQEAWWKKEFDILSPKEISTKIYSRQVIQLLSEAADGYYGERDGIDYEYRGDVVGFYLYANAIGKKDFTDKTVIHEIAHVFNAIITNEVKAIGDPTLSVKTPYSVTNRFITKYTNEKLTEGMSFREHDIKSEGEVFADIYANYVLGGLKEDEIVGILMQSLVDDNMGTWIALAGDHTP